MQWEQDLLEPQSLAELCDIVKESSFVRVVGRGHSFVPVCKARAAPRSATISLNKMNRVLDIDSEAMTVTVEGGITYRRLYEVLDAAPESVALANVQSHPGVTVAGTLSTGTHGSAGIDPETGRATLGAQSSLCRSVLMVMDDGTTKRWTRGDADWGAVVVSLGCLGVMAEVTLDLVPDHDFDMVTYTDLSCDHLIKHWRTVANQYQQIQVNGRWWGAPGSAAPPMMWVHLRQKVERGSPPKSKKDYPQTFCGQGQIAEVRRHRASELFGTSEAQMRELQFEYFVPLEHAEAAMQATREVSKDWHLPVETDPEGRPLANYTDIRIIGADDTQWLSATTTAEGGDTIAMAMGLNAYARGEVLDNALRSLEAALAPLQMRPHWGKLTRWGAHDFDEAYGDSLVEFRRVANTYDRLGKFRNAWTIQNLFSRSAPGDVYEATKKAHRLR